MTDTDSAWGGVPERGEGIYSIGRAEMRLKRISKGEAQTNIMTASEAEKE